MSRLAESSPIAYLNGTANAWSKKRRIVSMDGHWTIGDTVRLHLRGPFVNTKPDRLTGFWAFFLVGVLGGLGGLVVPTVAQATQGRYYHLLYAHDGNTYGGGSTIAYTQSLVSSDSPSSPTCAHLNHTIWVDTNGSGNGSTMTSDWAEIGYTYGDNYLDGTCGTDPNCGLSNYNNCMSYYYYWTNPSGGQSLLFFGSVKDSDLGGTHTYTTESCSNCYQVAFDGTIETYDSGAQGWTDEVEVGLEGTADGGTLGATISQYNHGLRTRACCTWGNWGTSSIVNTSGTTDHQASWTSYPEQGQVAKT